MSEVSETGEVSEMGKVREMGEISEILRSLRGSGQLMIGCVV